MSTGLGGNGKLCGTEERALWANAAANAVSGIINTRKKYTAGDNVSIIPIARDATDIADAIVLEFRKRNGSQP